MAASRSASACRSSGLSWARDAAADRNCSAALLPAAAPGSGDDARLRSSPRTAAFWASRLGDSWAASSRAAASSASWPLGRSGEEASSRASSSNRWASCFLGRRRRGGRCGSPRPRPAICPPRHREPAGQRPVGGGRRPGGWRSARERRRPRSDRPPHPFAGGRIAPAPPPTAAAPQPGPTPGPAPAPRTVPVPPTVPPVPGRWRTRRPCLVPGRRPGPPPATGPSPRGPPPPGRRPRPRPVPPPPARATPTAATAPPPPGPGPAPPPPARSTGPSPHPTPAATAGAHRPATRSRRIPGRRQAHPAHRHQQGQTADNDGRQQPCHPQAHARHSACGRTSSAN